ncbi:unnamed protein product [Ixodes pacificus]
MWQRAAWYRYECGTTLKWSRPPGLRSQCPLSNDNSLYTMSTVGAVDVVITIYEVFEGLHRLVNLCGVWVKLAYCNQYIRGSVDHLSILPLPCSMDCSELRHT